MSTTREDNSLHPPFGVGLLGAGPVVQAIHLPTLARLSNRFTVRHIMDVDEGLAATVAATAGAAHSTTVEALLADDSVDIVAVCSPARFHAAQVIAAMRAGKKAVFCEKPLAETAEDAAKIAAVSRETGVPVIVGAMHVFDPVWVALQPLLGDLPRTAHTIRSRIVIPPNSQFEDFASEIASRPEAGPMQSDGPEAQAAMIRGALLGLTIHDLPLVRAFLPNPKAQRIETVELTKPFGYLVALSDDKRIVQLTGAATPLWEPQWTLEVFDEDTHLEITFTPSYVHAGSATATLTRSSRTIQLGPFDANGYENEWVALADTLEGVSGQIPDLKDIVNDLTFATGIADAAAAHMMETAQ